MLIAAELTDIDGARAAPMLLENKIGDDAGRDRQRDEHQQDRASGNRKPTARPDELHDGCDEGRQRNECNQPGHGIARAQDGRIIGAPETAVPGFEEQRREMEIKSGPDAEDQAGHDGNGKRDHEAGSVHASIPARRPADRRYCGFGAWSLQVCGSFRIGDHQSPHLSQPASIAPSTIMQAMRPAHLRQSVVVRMENLPRLRFVWASVADILTDLRRTWGRIERQWRRPPKYRYPE